MGLSVVLLLFISQIYAALNYCSSYENNDIVGTYLHLLTKQTASAIPFQNSTIHAGLCTPDIDKFSFNATNATVVFTFNSSINYFVFKFGAIEISPISTIYVPVFSFSPYLIQVFSRSNTIVNESYSYVLIFFFF